MQARRTRSGIGIRSAHYARILSEGMPREIGFAEAISENFLERGGRPRAVLERVRRDVPVTLHGVSMSLGGFDPIPREYLQSLRQLALEIEAPWVSDHLCFGTHGGHYGHDLWPLPFTDECVVHLAARIGRVQDVLGARLVVENVSSYVTYQVSTLREEEFLCAVLARADCELLLDVNNVYVNAQNHGFDPYAYLDALPAERVRQLHVAGHLPCDGYLLDDHGREVSEPVWALYRHAVRRFPLAPTIVEWDGEVPALERLVAEATRAEHERMVADVAECVA